MANFFFLLWLLFIKTQEILSLHPGSDILALSFIFTPMKSYSYAINCPVFYQLIGR